MLGAAGLLRGKKATTHWAWTDLLIPLGAIPTKGRVVRDGKFMTGGGVTAGIDFALTIAAELAGQDVAEGIQLGIEYAPAPPFDAGSPDTARPELVATARAGMAGVRVQREARVAKVAAGCESRSSSLHPHRNPGRPIRDDVSGRGTGPSRVS